MSMKFSQLRTHWSADDAYLILSFLDELRETLLATYGTEITEQQRKSHLKTDQDDRQNSLEID